MSEALGEEKSAHQVSLCFSQGYLAAMNLEAYR
jgi:ribulose bisphosphate carboxylase small subunit